MPRPAFASRVVLLFIATLALQTPALIAQQRLVAVTGTVRDTSGAVVAGATVEAMVAGRPVAATATGTDGRYTIELAPATRHQLRVRLNGFADETVDLRTASESSSRDFVLKVAGVSDTVVVTAARLAESRATTTASIDVLTAHDIEALGSSSLGDVVRRFSASGYPIRE